MSKRNHFIGTALCLLLSACAPTRNASLDTTLRGYANFIRWSDFDKAASVVDPKYLAEHPMTRLDIERYHQVEVTRYDDAQPVILGDGTVTVLVSIDLINRHSQVQRSITDRQVWRYDEESKRWLITSGLPNITAEE
jgi:hypothetical protein